MEWTSTADGTGVQRGRFDSCLVGSGTLLIQCGDLLLSRGHRILGVLTADEAVIDWAGANGLRCADPSDDAVSFLGRQPFDHLFSIVNEHVLPSEVFLLPRRSAINYHDGPLPRYAGTHATTWAILNREASHAVSWHLIGELVDGGDILMQRTVEIADGDTAFGARESRRPRRFRKG
jgi:methionyl-tRNA formyltransferase